jgi:4-hydroxybenzoate polyprenyltransferase
MPRERNINAAAVGFFRLVRPADWVLAFAGAALGALFAGAGFRPGVALGAASLAAVLSGAFVNGDWLHRKTRVLSRPGNPLAREWVRPGEAKWLGFGLMAAGLAAAATLGLRPFAAALLTAAFMLVVNYFLDKVYFVRNLVAAAAVVIPVFYGWFWLERGAEPPVVAAVAAGLMAIAASVFRDVEERRADEVVARRTPAASGGRLPVLVAGGFALAATVISVLPYRLEGYSRRYLALVAAVGGLMLFYTILNLRHREPDPLLAGSTARMIKFLIFVFFAGTYWELCL